MRARRPASRWAIDFVLFASFLVSFLLDVTGLAAHQWLGVSIGAIAIYHLVTHWSWVKSVTARLTRASRQSRAYYLADAALLSSFLLILVSGLAISSWLSLPLRNYATWRTIHVAASVATLLLIALKIGLHHEWVTTTARRRFLRRATVTTGPQSARSATSRQLRTRRQFLWLMGIVGAASAAPLISGLDALLESFARGPSSSTPPQPSSANLGDSASDSATAGASTSDSAADVGGSLSGPVTCQAVCPNGCSYPGSCHRYVDRDRDGLCDLGECA